MTFTVVPPQKPKVTVNAAPRIKVSASRGRLYVSGPDARIAAYVDGAALNPHAQAYEISLTLESLRELHKQSGCDPQTFVRCCTDDVAAWARAAQASEKQVADVHAKLATGYRTTLPWYDVKGTRPPFAHQEIMATVACELDGVAYLCEMGTSKTRPAIEALRYQMEHKNVDVAVVICPRGVMGTWEREVGQWSEGMTTLRLDMQVKERRRIIESYAKVLPKGKLVLVLNYDVLYLLVDELILLAQTRKLGLIVDEMHRLANPQSKVSKAAQKLAQHTQWRLGLTGTPIRKNIHDIWAQWYLIDLGVTFGANFVQYRREFMQDNPYNQFEMSARDGAMEEVGLRMRRRGLRYTKDECLDLPPKIWEKIEIELTPEQKKAYKQMEAELIAQLDGSASPDDEDAEDDRVATAATQLVMLLRLTQITSGHIKDTDGNIYRFQKNPKLDALEEIVRETIQQQQQIVWAIYKDDIDSVVQRLADLYPRIIDGRQVGAKGQRERDATETDFRDGAFRLLVANPAAGGEGLNLQAASMAHYFSQGYSLIQRQQSEDRCHRMGSEIHNKVTYNDIVAKGTVDEIVLAAVAEKKEIAEIVVDLRKHIGLKT